MIPTAIIYHDWLNPGIYYLGLVKNNIVDQKPMHVRGISKKIKKILIKFVRFKQY